MRKTTLQELGARLPYGFHKDGVLEKTFQLRPYKGKIDRALGLWREANGAKYDENQSFAAVVAKLMSLLISQAGSRANALDTKGDSTAEAELWLHRWSLPDVLYAYIYARVTSLDEFFYVPVACQARGCNFKTSSAKFDLRTIDVRVAETIDDIHIWYDLIEPFPSREPGKMIRSMKLAPIMWSSLMKTGFHGTLDAMIEMVALEDSIVAINKHEVNQSDVGSMEGTSYQVLPNEIDEISKRDLVALNHINGELATGVDLNTVIPCPKCRRDIIDVLNWEFGFFFGASSQPVTSTHSEKMPTC